MAFVTEEDCPYPAKFLTDYPETKAISEQDALNANCPEMATTAIRPRLIWGPGDPHLIPRMIERHDRLKIIGDGQNKVGICYVDNAAHGHILACDALGPDSPNAGKAYFVADDEVGCHLGLAQSVHGTSWKETHHIKSSEKCGVWTWCCHGVCLAYSRHQRRAIYD